MALYPNGRAPASALVSIYGCVASPDMARRVQYVKEEYDRTHVDNLSINEIYRTFDEQVRQKERWTNLGQPGNAAAPGYSNHGAWDVGAVDWSSIDIQGRREIAARVGLIHNIANESWHAAAVGPITVPLADWAGGNYTPIDNLTPEQILEQELMSAADDIVNDIKARILESEARTKAYIDAKFDADHQEIAGRIDRVLAPKVREVIANQDKEHQEIAGRIDKVLAPALVRIEAAVTPDETGDHAA